MLRRIVGITGISLWTGLIAVVVLGGFRANANGEQMFGNLPEGWKVERSFTVSKEQTAAISRKLGARISKLSNTYLSIQGERLQVNVLYCRTKKEAEKIHRSILKMKGDPAFCLKLDNSVVEFVGDDVGLAKKAAYELGLTLWQLDSVARKLIKKIPAGWRVENSFIVPRDQTAAIGKKLGGRIKNLSNTIFSVQGKRFQVNVIECVTPAGAEKVHRSILKMKGDPAFCLKLGNSVVEFVGNNVELAKKAVYELGLTLWQLDSVARKLIKKIPAGWRVENSFIVPRDQTAAIGKKLGGRIKNLSNTIFSVDGKRFQVNVIECVTPAGAEKIHRSILKMKGDPAFCLKLGNSVVEFVGDDVELAKRAVYELGIKPGAGEAKQKQISKGDTLETMAKDLVDLLVKGNYEEAVTNFDDTMTKALPADKLQEVWNTIIAQVGSFVEQLGVRKEKILQYEVVFVTCKFENAVLEAKVIFNDKKRIAGLFFVTPELSTENPERRILFNHLLAAR